MGKYPPHTCCNSVYLIKIWENSTDTYCSANLTRIWKNCTQTCFNCAYLTKILKIDLLTHVVIVPISLIYGGKTLSTQVVFVPISLRYGEILSTHVVIVPISLIYGENSTHPGCNCAYRTHIWGKIYSPRL